MDDDDAATNFGKKFKALIEESLCTGRPPCHHDKMDQFLIKGKEFLIRPFYKDNYKGFGKRNDQLNLKGLDFQEKRYRCRRNKKYIVSQKRLGKTDAV